MVRSVGAEPLVSSLTMSLSVMSRLRLYAPAFMRPLRP